MNLYLKKTIYSILIALIYLVGNVYFISKLNFNEDAFIMFRYVEMFVKGYGITFYPGGEHLEGATDFLWFILLSILNKAHIDPRIAAMILNAIGAFIITYILTTTILETKDKKLIKILFPFSFLWLLFIPFFSAFGGFSVFLYSSIILFTLYLLNKEEKISWVPILSIIIALFRPDGVIVGLCFTCIGLYICVKEKRRQYIIHMLIALLIGVTYFLWRYNYFKELLPLPLYVKQASSLWGSFSYNIWDFSTYAVMVGILLFILCYILQTKREKKKIFILIIPSIIFFMALALAHQSQNIAYRFQAPVIYMGYYLIIVMIINLYETKNKYRKLCVGLFFLLIPLSLSTTNEYVSWTYSHNKRAYINSFSPKFAKDIVEDGNVIAITEAGRLPYWIDKKVKIIDLVGLNTKYTAKNKLTESYIEKINPDIIMAYIKNNFEGTKNVYKISDKNIFYKSVNVDMKGKEFEAMLVTSKFIFDHWDEYDVFMVKFLQFYPHVYAIKKNLNKSELMYKLLNESFNDTSSYWNF